MNWKLKAFAFKALSVLPASDALHYQLQRLVTRTLPRPAAAHASISKHAAHFAGIMASCLERPLEKCSVLEFGAGRDLALALALRAQGIGRVVATDIAPLAKIELLRVAAARVLGPGSVPASIEELSALGIQYRAPLDMRASGLSAEAFDCVISSEVLEHIPAVDLPALLAEVRRILKKDGITVMKIDYSDHYARSDPGISRFNFLKYSEAEWQRYNSRFQYLNRWRHSDYTRAFVEAGFSIVLERPRVVAPVPEVMQHLAAPFRCYAAEDLFVEEALIAARRNEDA